VAACHLHGVGREAAPDPAGPQGRSSTASA
jgi:hypothetical protein